MKRIAHVLFILVVFSALGVPTEAKRAKPAPGEESEGTQTVSKTGFVKMEMPSGSEWRSEIRSENDDGIIEVYYPEGSTVRAWKEMIQLEANWTTPYKDPRVFARLLTREAERNYPVVVFDIVAYEIKDVDNPYCAFRLKLGSDTAADGFHEIQLWKLMQRGPSRFVAQYSFKGEGEPFPEEREAEIWELLKAAYICDPTMEDNPCYDPEQAREEDTGS